MPLRGQIEDYGLADALQLVAKSQKSGMLRCDSDADDLRLLIESNWIVSAESAGRPNDAKLGNRLVRAGVITDGELGTALVRRARTSEPITEILLDEQLATVDTLKQFATLLATETVFEVFTWQRGTYEFLEGAIQVPRTFVDPMPLDEILMQGIVLMDEWPQIEGRVLNGAQEIDQRWPLPPETEPDVDALFGFGGTSNDSAGADMGPNERLVHDLCRPGVDIQAVVDQAPFHKYETYRCLSRLVGEHFVRLT